MKTSGLNALKPLRIGSVPFRTARISTLAALAVALGLGSSRAAVDLGTFEELVQLLKNNLSGVSDADLQKAAVQGLVSQFPGRVQWVNQTNTIPDPVQTGLRSQILDGRFGYLRLGGIVSGSAEEVAQVLGAWTTNRLQGGILDLRGCRSRDFGAAAGLAEIWVGEGKALFDWGDGLRKSKGRAGMPEMPWVILVNQETAGSAEALAAALRAAETGILVGRSATAGQAAGMKEFGLKDGQKIRLSAQPVKMGDGKEIPLSGVMPDLTVQVDAAEEKAHLELGIKPMPRLSGMDGRSGGSTNRVSRRRINEADLVRMQKEGKKPELELEGGVAEAAADELGTLQDPVLNRGFDLLKALVVVRRTAGK